MVYYLFHARYLHNDIFRYVTHDISQYHKCYHGCIEQAHYQLIIATRPGHKFSGFLQLCTFTLVEPTLARLEQLL